MRFDDPDEDETSEQRFDEARSSLARRSSVRPVAVALITLGIAGTLGLQAWQLGRYDGVPDMWFQLVFGLGFSLLSATVMAGVVLLVLDVWLVPLLERLISSASGGAERDPVD